MKHSQISRNAAKAFFAFAALAIVGACSDNNTVAPTVEAAAIVAPANFATVGTSVVFRVNNAEGVTKRIGSHLLYIPAGAICDLSSSYGTTEWDKPCKTLRGSVVITATVLEDAQGQPYVDFQPAMRFESGAEVMLFLRETVSATQSVAVKYCNAVAYCYDESLTDPSLKPFRVGNTAVIGRRIKHFSGYMVTSGGTCEESTDPVCPGGMTRRSGYMVASGQDVGDILNDDEGKGPGKPDSR